MPSPPSHLRRLHDLGVAKMEDEGTSFELGPDGRLEVEVPPGIYRVDIATPSGLRPRTDLGVVVDDLALADIALPRATQLSIRVVDDAGQPIENALVLVDTQQWVRPQGSSEREEPAVGVSRWHGRTDEGGRVAAPALPGANHPVRVAADGFLPRGVPSNGRGAVTVELERGAPQRVTVTDERGRPVARAVVRFGESLVPVAVTDDQGRATVTAATDRILDYQVESGDLGYSGFRTPVRGTEESLQVRLEPPASLFGKVIDRTSGDPVAGALVWSLDRPSDFATTDPDGRYELPTWTSSRGIRLGVAAQLYSSENTSMGNVAGEAPTVALEPNRSITLLVRNELGESVPRALVTVWPRDRSSMRSQPKPNPTDEEGRIALRGMRQGSYVALVEHPDYAVAEADLTLGPDIRETIEVTLPNGVAGWGTVLDMDNQPLAGVEVWLVPETTYRRSGVFDSSAGTRKSITDLEGRFDLAPVAAGRYDLFAEADGFAPGRVHGFELEFDDQEIGTLTLEPAALFSGRILDEEGQPVPGATLFLREADFRRSQPPASKSAASAEDGTFEIDRIGRGRYVWGVQARGFVRPESQEISLPLDQPLEVRLERGLALRGTVRGENGEGLAAHVGLYWIDLSNEPYEFPKQRATVRSEADGTFEIAPATQGRHVLMVNAVDHMQRLVDVEVRGEAPDPIDISLERGAVFSGTVTGDGLPLAGAQVSVNPTGAEELTLQRMLGPSAATQSDGEGRYRLTGVPNGEMTITAAADGYRPTVHNLDISGDRRFDLELYKGLRVTGRIVDESGDPVVGALVRAMVSKDRSSWSGGQHQGFSGPDGAFEIGGLEPGWAQLEVSKEGFATPTVPEIELRESAPDLEIVLDRGFTVSGRILGLEPDQYALIRLNMFATGVSQFGRNYREATLDYQGGFSMPNVSRGDWRLSASFQETGRVLGRNLEVDRDIDDVELDFGAGLVLRGTINVDGQPASGHIYAGSLDQTSATSAEVDSSGIFELEGLQAGPIQISLSTEDPVLQHVDTIDLQSDVDLSIDLTTTALNVVVLRGDGAPVEGASVLLISDLGTQSQLGLTGANGALSARLQTDQNRQGNTLAVDHPTLGSGRAMLSGEPTVEIRLGQQEALRISITSSIEGTPPPTAFWLQRGEISFPGGSQGGASATLEAPPGNYLLWSSAGTQVAGPVSVAVPGEATVQLESGGWTRLKSRSAAFGARVIARRGELRHPQPFYADAAGSQPVGPLPPGLWTLEVIPLGTTEVTARLEVQILAGETIELEVP
ncbi:MAG: carboxypeptidase regulatory-like domain-containing protein [Acidobacteriota bacterium]